MAASSGEVVEHVAEIDVAHIADRDDPEKPIVRAGAQSSIVVTIAPDCVRNAILPGRIAAGANVAFRPMRGTAMPRQLGPTTRREVWVRRRQQERAARSLPLGNLTLGEARCQYNGGAGSAAVRVQRCSAGEDVGWRGDDGEVRASAAGWLRLCRS